MSLLLILFSLYSLSYSFSLSTYYYSIFPVFLSMLFFLSVFSLTLFFRSRCLLFAFHPFRCMPLPSQITFLVISFIISFIFLILLPLLHKFFSYTPTKFSSFNFHSRHIFSSFITSNYFLPLFYYSFSKASQTYYFLFVSPFISIFSFILFPRNFPLLFYLSSSTISHFYFPTSLFHSLFLPSIFSS